VELDPTAIVVTGTLQQQAWRDQVVPPVELVRPGLWSVPTVFPDNPLRYVLTYVMEHEKGIAIVDTGWPCEQAWDGLVSGIGQTGWDVSDVNAILITHGHGDHFGLAKKLRDASGAWIGMHEADAKTEAKHGEGEDFRNSYRAADDAWLTQRGGQPIDPALSQPARGKMFSDFHVAPDRLIADGDRPLGANSDLVAVWTPGHTPGHLCFFDRRRSLMLTGDHVLPRITPNISPAPGVEDDVLGDYLASLSLLTDFEVEEVLPAHEYRFKGLSARVSDLRDHHGLRLGEVMDVLRERPGADSATVAEYLVWSRDWTQMQGFIRRSAIGEAYAHLVHLERTGHLVNKGTAVDSWHIVADYHLPSV
jgi:glyoxylase-like metal-dependent hydrolase (beta-lactamase superfamily II)